MALATSAPPARAAKAPSTPRPISEVVLCHQLGRNLACQLRFDPTAHVDPCQLRKLRLGRFAERAPLLVEIGLLGIGR